LRSLNLGPFGLRWYALGYVVGLLLAWRMMLKLVSQPQHWQGPAPLTRDDIDDFLFYATLGILLGGRIGYVLLYRPDMLSDPLSLLKIWEGGMSFHGGFVGVCLAVIGTAIGRKISLIALADVAAIASPMGIGLVRCANFINQELYGRVTDVPWAFIFKTDPAGLPRHPSQLYQAAMEGFLIFIVLQIAVAKFAILKRRGMASGVFILLYGIVRNIGEQFREPDAGLIFGMTRGEVYSIPMVLVGLGFIIFALRQPKPIADNA
jgi:phosphatidylglycerol---prolipoprotein diacylglyceryl transferase